MIDRCTCFDEIESCGTTILIESDGTKRHTGCGRVMLDKSQIKRIEQQDNEPAWKKKLRKLVPNFPSTNT